MSADDRRKREEESEKLKDEVDKLKQQAKQLGVGEEAESSLVEQLNQGMAGLQLQSDPPAAPRPLSSPCIEAVAQYFTEKRPTNVIVMAGAGISTSAGIPDFRTPGFGIYDNLQKYELPDPMAIFSIDYFKENPKPFFVLAKELFPDSFKPTICHYFLKLLHDEGLLKRHYTQNIDMLETLAGLPEDKLVEAHGTFRISHCTRPDCRQEYSLDWMKEQIFNDVIPTCSTCSGVVKPDIVFFGEELPSRFRLCVAEDLSKCDMLIVLGTSLVVQPFASLVGMVPDSAPRLLINLEKSDSSDPWLKLFGLGNGFNFDSEDNYRDVFWQGECDKGCQKLAELLGWKDKLAKLCREGAVCLAAASTEAGTSVAASSKAFDRSQKTGQTKATSSKR